MSTRGSRSSDDSYDHDSYGSSSTAPSSLNGAIASAKDFRSRATKQGPERNYGVDLSPSTNVYPRSSVETYSSLNSTDDLNELDRSDVVDDTAIPPLRPYTHDITDANVRPSSPEYFAELFPSMNRLSIRHDDFTADGNMNLRIDTVVPGRRQRSIQLFHLRMYDLNKRDFSLRRYCRDSGREVCNSKRKYTEPAMQSRPNLQRSVSSAMKSFTRPQPKRAPTSGSMLSTLSRPGTSYSNSTTGEDLGGLFDPDFSLEKHQKVLQRATNSIKLEFSNYARVDVERCGSKGSKRYEFNWWGHKYAWKRVTDKLTGAVSFHLFRDGSNTTPVAHIVPENRSPTEVRDDNKAGGWIPPCHMWLSDEELVMAMTDVADVVVATGLMALVDDCIKQRWGPKAIQAQRLGLPARSKTVEFDHNAPKSFVQQLFSRRNSDHARPQQHTQRQFIPY
ncbi:hypothetical protein G7054_g12474 [Neopestalotiopsis clavispora]|nr:hypothetical protein G7054_g12474 [Neopestalotiopsis clavispora]